VTTRFHVDLDQLDELIHDLTDQHLQLAELSTRLDLDVSHLQGAWDGRAAEAQAAAHTRWQSGFGSMREALAVMVAAAETARSNYNGATEANLRMWRQVS